MWYNTKKCFFQQVYISSEEKIKLTLKNTSLDFITSWKVIDIEDENLLQIK